MTTKTPRKSARPVKRTSARANANANEEKNRAHTNEKQARSHTPSSKAFSPKKVIVVAAMLLLAAVIILTSLLASDAYAPRNSSAAPAESAQQTQTASAQNANSNENPNEPKKTAAGNQAIAHQRTAEERMASSESANDVKPGPKTVYLTFDDGPSPNTPRILEILSEYGMQATWFVKGDQPQIAYVKDIWNAGNQIANHTYTHDYKQVYASIDSYWDDLHQAGSAIKDYLDFKPTLVRFPGGSRNSFNADVVDSILSRMAAERYHYFDWNVSSGDGGDHNASFIENYVVEQAQGCHSCCVLMHDSAAKDTTVEALPAIIEWFIDNGFEFDVLLADSFGYHF